jgi:glucose-6-phosphate 1-dehydrogenase
VTQTELRLVFHRPPRVRFYDAEWMPEPNQLVIKLDPTTGIRILAQAQRGTTMRPEEISLDMEFAEEGGEGPTPYEVLLHAAMQGNSQRFTRQDQVEEAWRILAPLIDSPPPVHGYAPGTWGPKEADELVAGYGRWHEPWMAS